MAEKSKVILAYSGGLDTTVIIPWLKENYDYDVIAVCVNLGQGDDWDKIKQRALDTGAAECIVEDVREEYIRDYVFPAVKANAIYEDRYLLGTSTARPLIGKVLVKYARQKKVIDSLDVLYMTRVQKERFINEDDYVRLKDSYILTADKLEGGAGELAKAQGG
ncbi:hypothetical protein AGMMS49936_11680 [Endomicrobiia bacterium]|nr:hypothetical protein AGMMS49936_11680 [Endomicrobiia bacterium]